MLMNNLWDEVEGIIQQCSLSLRDIIFFYMIIAKVLSNSAVNCRNKEASRIFCFNCVDCQY